MLQERPDRCSYQQRMDHQTNCSYCQLVYPVLRPDFHQHATLDPLKRNRQCLVKTGDGPQGVGFLELYGGLVDITKLLCLIPLRLVLRDQRLRNRAY